MIRKLGSAGLALSVLWAIISLALKGGVGVSQAGGLGPSDFAFNNPKAEITHETANQCLTPAGSFISCETPSFHSDSYEILANLAINPLGDFQSDLNQTIFITLAAGTCPNPTVNSTFFFNSTWTGLIPGGSLHKVTNKNFTIYNFEGNIPGFACIPSLCVPGSTCVESLCIDSAELFDHAEFNLKIPTTGSPTISLEGNANLCGINGPMALEISLGEPGFDFDNDSACVNIPAPEFDTLDISSAFCFGG
jgi:hypothetical protein